MLRCTQILLYWKKHRSPYSYSVFVVRSRRSGVRRADGLQGARCNAHQADYHLTFAADPHHLSPTKSTVVAATLPSPCSGGATDQSCNSENDYFRTWQLQRHVSCPAATTTSAITAVRTAGIGRPTPTSLRLLPAGPVSRARAVPEHIYESPRLERRELMAPSTECTCCELPRRGSVDLLAMTTTDSTQQSPTIQYYELDQSARPVHV